MKIDNDKWLFTAGCLESLMQQKDELYSCLDGIMLMPESPVFEAFHTTSESLVAALTYLIDENGASIEYFVNDCDFGNEPKEAGIAGNTKLIDSLEKLRWLIEVEQEK